MSGTLTIRNKYDCHHILKNCRDNKSLLLNLPLVKKDDVVYGEYIEIDDHRYINLSIPGLDSTEPFEIVEGDYKDFNKESFIIKDIKLIHSQRPGYHFEIQMKKTRKKAAKLNYSPQFISIENYNSSLLQRIDDTKDIIGKVYSNILELLFKPSAISPIATGGIQSIILLSIICHNLWNLKGVLLVDSLKMQYLKYFTEPSELNNLNNPFPLKDNEWESLSELMGLYTEIDGRSAKYINENILPGTNITEGKWIFLCPENIEAFSKDFINYFNYKYKSLTEKFDEIYREGILKSLFKWPLDDYIFKKVLLHELGHLVFSTSPETTDHKIFDETRANWFSSIFMNNIELYLLRLVTSVQPYRYHKIMPIPSIDFGNWKADFEESTHDFLAYYDDVMKLFFCSQENGNGKLYFEYTYDF